MRRYSTTSHKKLYCIIAAVIAVIAVLMILLIKRINSELETVVSKTIYFKTEDTVYSCINSYLENSSDITDYIKINKDPSGSITDIESDSAKINLIKSKLTNEITKALDSVHNESVDFPVGSLTGIDMLSGSGFDISVSCHTIGNINTELNSSIESCGINQIKYSLYIDIKVEICVILPSKSKNITFDEQYLLAESVIVGDIPQVYLKND